MAAGMGPTRSMCAECGVARIPSCVAVTKVDLMDDEGLELARMDVADHVDGTFDALKIRLRNRRQRAGLNRKRAERNGRASASAESEGGSPR